MFIATDVPPAVIGRAPTTRPKLLPAITWGLACVAAWTLNGCSGNGEIPPLTDLAVIPLPTSVTDQPGRAALGCNTLIQIDDACPDCVPAGQELIVSIRQALQCDGKRGATGPPIRFLAPATDLPPESYRLQIQPDQITVAASDTNGYLYAAQTLRQLALAVAADDKDPVQLPAGVIEDRPRYAWRGLMLDVARHFFTVDQVKPLIDAAAALKLNRFHLHLTDDQGWRIHIDSWPRLSEVGGATEVGGGQGGFYTQAEYADLVDYAARRGMILVPEIDMPGHINAALSAYGILNCDGVPADPYTGTDVGISSLCLDNDASRQFAADVIGEVAALTPGPYIHIGGDEAFEADDVLYARFISDIRDIVADNNKTMIGWEEAAEAVSDGTWIAQQWLLPERILPAAAAGAPIILSPYDRTYLSFIYDTDFPVGNVWAGALDIYTAYDWDPDTYAKGLDSARILGIEAAVWTEKIPTIADVQLSLFPRLLATAEVAWSDQARRQVDDFITRVASLQPLLDQLQLNYYQTRDIPWPAPSTSATAP